jgi:hypothetical protein
MIKSKKKLKEPKQNQNVIHLGRQGAVYPYFFCGGGGNV